MTTFRTILFAGDLGEASQQAFRSACALVANSDTKLHVLFVAEHSPVMEQLVGFDEAGRPASVESAESPRRLALRERLASLYVPPRPMETTYQVLEGEPAEEIVRYAREIGADLIALSSHGRSGLQRLLAGSTAESVMRHAPCPVLVRRALDAETDVTPRTILFPTDFSPGADAAKSVAAALAKTHGAALVVVSVLPVDFAQGGEIAIPIDPEPTRDGLEALAESLIAGGVKPPIQTQLRRGEPSTEILAAAKETGAEMIVMGTQGRGGLIRALMGSVAESLQRRAQCPVISVRDNARFTVTSVRT